MKENPRLTLIVAQSVIIALLLVYLVLSVYERADVKTLEHKLISTERILDDCIGRNDSLSLLIHEMRISSSLPPFLDRRQVDALVKRGLNDPVSQIRNALVNDPGLIISSSVLGGSMGFYYRDGIHILNERWVFAYFEDGHVAGAMLLRYDILNNGEIGWEVLDEFIY